MLYWAYFSSLFLHNRLHVFKLDFVDEKMSLVALDEETGNAAVETSKTLSEWITYVDETQYEFTR